MSERDTPDLPPGTSVNGAIIEELVDRGGYGTVYRARDKLTGTLFALKFVPLYRAEAWAKREGVVAMSFKHKNLVRQVGFSYWPPVLPEFFCLKMLYVEGRPLDVWAWEENPDTQAVVGKLVGVVRGLAVVHDENVVHRDVKEANILVRDSDGEPVLLDFGAAKREGQTTITEGMFPPGTPHYRSPEAWRFGLEHWNDRRVTYRPGKADDQYALGVVLYRLLTRRFPFEVGWDDEASVNAVINKEPLPPHLVNPHVPLVVSDLCMKLLEKTPEKRYPSVLELGKELTHLLARADASWRVPLHDGPRVPRRGHREAATRKKEPEAAAPPVEPTPSTRTPATVAGLPLRDIALQALRRAVVWMAVLVSAVLVGWWLSERRKPEPQPTPVASPSPTLRSLLGQEVAPSWPPPEIEQAAAPPPVEKTPAVVASLVTRPKDDALKKPQAPSPQGDMKQKGILSPMARWCLGAAAAANTACPGAQVRPAPEAEPCPAGAVETMTETLGIGIGSTGLVSFTRENPKFITVREGVTSARLIYGGVREGFPGDRWKLPTGTILSGRLLFGDGRVHARFTEAQTPTGDTFKVCMEAGDEGKQGVPAEPDGGPETAKVFATMGVKAVRRFE
ncbi:protein kinase domain-containing protein [Archangium sp.]|uniref:serine/threonine protein kinase n=1 Tax=Archangium sp. TaxID=1872627 RepID=UPI00286ABFF8|nr:protein kinase [Archangium sp.]